MTPALQAIAALALVACAALYVARRAWHSWRAARGCDCR